MSNTIKRTTVFELASPEITAQQLGAVHRFREWVLDHGHPLVQVIYGRDDFGTSRTWITVTLDMRPEDIDVESAAIAARAEVYFGSVFPEYWVSHLKVDHYYNGEATMLRETLQEAIKGLRQ